MTNPTLLFDGYCNFCNSSVQFILKHEKAPVVDFIAWQHLEESLRTKIKKQAFENSTVVFIKDENIYLQSTAVLKLAAYLKFPFNLLQVFYIFPAFLRDAVYRFVAANRYKWFGKKNECPIPPPEWKARLAAKQ